MAAADIAQAKAMLIKYENMNSIGRDIYRSWPEGATRNKKYPRNAPCFYCEGEIGSASDLCDICVHNPDSKIWFLKDVL
jgi:hypothetical protein